MSRILSLLIASLVTISISALPEWPRKYATTVVRGHVKNMPPNAHTFNSIYGVTNIKEKNEIPEMAIDSVGFCLKWELCWPIESGMEICDGIQLKLHLCPGDTIDLEIDYGKAQALKKDIRKLFEEAIQIRGAKLAYSPLFRELANTLHEETVRLDTKALKEPQNQTYTGFRDWQWSLHQDRLKKVKTSKLKKDEKILLQLMLEKRYIESCNSFKLLMSIVLTKEELAAAKREITMQDPHASKWLFPKNLTAAYYFNSAGFLDHLQANGLDKQPFGRYLKERRQAEKLIERIRTFEEVSTEDIEQLATEFRQPAKEVKAEMAEKAKANAALLSDNWKPTGEASTWLQQIVERHHGRVIFVDFWATWCGPCNRGINEMATVKDDYAKRGVDFVYITDGSSSTDGFLSMKAKHAGDHFLFKADDMKKMNIPQYTGSIPHYLIYDRNGKLIKAIVGWNNLKAMTDELDKALGQ